MEMVEPKRTLSPQLSRQLTLAAVALSVGGLLLNVVAIAIPYWGKMTIINVNFGLWQECHHVPQLKLTGCTTKSIIAPINYFGIGMFQAVRAMELLGMIVMLIAVVCGIVWAFVKRDITQLPIIAAVSALLAGLFMIIGAIIFGAMFSEAFQDGDIKFHAGLPLALLAGASSLVAGSFFILVRKQSLALYVN